jgi:hypothetical protein
VQSHRESVSWVPPIPKSKKSELLWTRIISCNKESPPVVKLFECGKEKLLTRALSQAHGSGDFLEWKMFFDPKKFNDLHRPLKIDDYRLKEEELQKYAIIATNIRSIIDKRANS